MDKSKFIPHVETNGLQVDNLRSSITPDAPGTSQTYLRIATDYDPFIALTTYTADTIYAGYSYASYRELLTGSFGGAGVHIRNSATLADDSCYTPLGVCSHHHLATLTNLKEVVDYSVNALTTLPVNS